MAHAKGQQFQRFIRPIIAVLKSLGGSGNSSEVIDKVIEEMKISEAVQQETTKNGQSRVKNQIHWARFFLAKAGLLESSGQGIWTLSTSGMQANLTDDDVTKIVHDVQAGSTKQQAPITTKPPEDTAALHGNDEDMNWEDEFLKTLHALPPAGFERLCQRLLRESGFQQVTVTGRSGDGGIDGFGILQINPFVSFSVLFQCKRYQGAVTPSQVRDFRGAMMGRADKGIIITTGSFTTEAKREARRDGVPPIELVDADKLVELFAHLELGLKPSKVLDIDHQFFNEFKV
jgi:restriction system protein